MSEEKPSLIDRLRAVLRKFFFPGPTASRVRRATPYALLGLLTLVMLVTGAYGWEYTNSPPFCGTTCHTMPPEFAAYEISPHARVDCVECHIGRGFIAQRISRKAGDAKHIIALAFTTYEFPIRAGELRPARDTCEQCHYPAKFSDDSLREVVHYATDEANTRTSTFLAMRTGGGSEREGLGRGIHWHIENPIYYFAEEGTLEQEIPYVRVLNSDGTYTEYLDLDAEHTAEEYGEMELEQMDCLTCHNRISHNIMQPEQSIDRAISRGLISQDIPYIKYLGSEVLERAGRGTASSAIQTIRDLEEYYADEFPEYYSGNKELVQQAVETMVQIYNDSVFSEQEVNWDTHPNNIGHKDWPGCFRCHDGNHVSETNEAIRLECNLCHSIPEVVTDDILEPTLALSAGLQPSSHFNSLWIAQHRDAFDDSCQACHTVGNPGGTDNTSFCSNSACHGSAWEFAGFDAPALADLIKIYEPVEQQPEVEIPAGDTPVYTGQVETLFQKCVTCHSNALTTGGLSLETFDATMKGGASGPVILSGDAEGSRLIQVQRSGHFGTFKDDELQLVIDWINAGAPNN